MRLSDGRVIQRPMNYLLRWENSDVSPSTESEENPSLPSTNDDITNRESATSNLSEDSETATTAVSSDSVESSSTEP